MANLFDKFGGVRPMAEHLLQPPSTVASWKATGRIPANHQPAVLDKAAELGLDITADDVVFPLVDRDHADAGTPCADQVSAGNAPATSPETADA